MIKVGIGASDGAGTKLERSPLIDSLPPPGKVIYTESIMVSGRKLLLVLIMLWLPLQGAIAAIMPLCVQAKQMGASLDIPAVTAPCDLHDDGEEVSTTHNASDNTTSNLPCESLPCYASFSTLLPATYASLISTGGSSYAIAFDSRFTSAILQQPQHPPLA